MNTKAIESIVTQPAWEEVEKYLAEKLIRAAVNVKTDGKTNEEVAREVAGYEIAARKVNEVLLEIKNIKHKVVTEKESFE